jgi:vacuolar-type H+-ATPase subunit H
MLDLIDQMRVAIPDEVKKAQQVLSQRDRILAQAQEEANRTLSLAREKSEGLVEQSAIVEAARLRSKEIEEQAQIDGEKTRREADDYVIQTLSRLEMQLERSLTQARNGILALRHVS